MRYRATPVPCKCPIILSTTPASFSHPIAAADHSSHGPDLHLIVLLLDPNTDVLNLETARASSATSTLELAALGDNVGFLVLVGTHAEVLDSLTGVLGSTQDQSVAASGGAQSKLIQSDGLAASLDDASTSSSGESQSGNVDLGEGQQAVVIGDGAHNDDGTLLALLVDVTHDAGQGDRGAVDLGHKKASEDDLVEAGIRAARQEAVQLHQELEVDIVTLGILAVSALDVVAVKIDT